MSATAEPIARRRLLGGAVAGAMAGAVGAAGAIGAIGAAGAGVAPDWPPREGLRLWPGDPPGAPTPLPRPDLRHEGELDLRGVATPMAYVFRPATPNGVGLVAMPGGGFEFLSVENEGLKVARAFTARGYTMFVLAYRLPAEGWRDRPLVPLQDAQRALRLIRARAADFAIDPRRLGVIGFSAGGHVAASLATTPAAATYPPVDGADALSARPAFAGLVYPVTTLGGPGVHLGSRRRLLGDAPADAAVARHSPVRHVDRDTPPCFLVHAFDDQVVPPICSLDWLAACRAQAVPVEAHLLQRGGHGFGVGLPESAPGAQWPALFDRWVADQVRGM